MVEGPCGSDRGRSTAGAGVCEMARLCLAILVMLYLAHRVVIFGMASSGLLLAPPPFYRRPPEWRGDMEGAETPAAGKPYR